MNISIWPAFEADFFFLRLPRNLDAKSFPRVHVLPFNLPHLGFRSISVWRKLIDRAKTFAPAVIRPLAVSKPSSSCRHQRLRRWFTLLQLRLSVTGVFIHVVAHTNEDNSLICDLPGQRSQFCASDYYAAP